MFCECCDKVKKTTVPAEGFCADCYEFMCATCIHYHQIYKDGHTIQRQDTMPQDFCVDKCSVHFKEIVKFYCKTCSKPICCTCKTSDHKECADITFIPTFVNSADFQGELEHLEERMTCLANNLQHTDNIIDFNLKDVSNNQKKSISAIEKHKKETEKHFTCERKYIIDSIDKEKEEMLKRLEQKMVEKLKHFDQQQGLIMKKFEETKDKTEAHYKTDITKLQLLSSQTKTMRSDLLTLQQNLDRKKTARDKCGLFIAMKNASEKSTKLKDDGEKVTKENCIEQLEFVANKQCVDINCDLKSVTFGQLVDRSKIKRYISHFESFTKFMVKDKLLCIRKFSDSRIMTIIKTINADGISSSYKLVLLDLDINKIINETILKTGAKFLTKITGDQVAVVSPQACNNMTEVQIYHVSQKDQINFQKEFRIQDHCTGMVSSNSNLISLLPKTGDVKTLDKEGHILNTFKLDQKSKYGCISISPNLKTLHIALNKTIYYTDLEGNILNKNYDLWGNNIVKDMVTDRSGAIFIIAQKDTDVRRLKKSYEIPIYQVSADITTSYHFLLTCIPKTLLEILSSYSEDFTMCYCDRKDRLYVSYETCRGITVFKVY